ncbi:neuromedin-U receptor 1-like [Zerene cesonia]|uniref:neuromedin-U receptor 1-like n=1 Tax=Zerene cesonia TaxID=33412 RepID=UPI0018E57298|nr:neuromedin-U receptor 1-like [Zerene cesonia]
MNSTQNEEDDLKIWSHFLIKAFEEKSQWIDICCVVILLVIFFVSMIGNVLTCYVIYSVKSMHTATNFYLFDLAVSDLIVTFSILFDIYDYLTDFSKVAESMCKLRFFFVVSLWNNGILVMTILAIERYIVIWYPMLLGSSPVCKRVAKVITVISIVAILESLPEIWTVGFIKTKKMSICFTVPTEIARKINGVLALVTFVFPLWWSTGFRFLLINTWLSVVLNPILFSLMSTKFRKALKVNISDNYHCFV